jgi:Flp pilus assembly pilin Flp
MNTSTTGEATQSAAQCPHLLTRLRAGARGQVAGREHGQGMLEYGVIIMAVAISVIVAVLAFGTRVTALFSTSASSLP